jgi:energy-coupling factor transporter ATP-binding protein EcfA2
MSEQPAKTLKHAWAGGVLNPLHLVRPDDPWYVNLDAQLPAAHYGVTRKLHALFEENSEWLHMGLVGHGGTGKSTLVRQTMTGLAKRGIMPVYINSEESFDQVDMTFADVVLVLVEAVVRTLVLDTQTIQLDPRRVELVRGWFADEVVGESHRKELVGELQTSAGAQVGLPQLASAAAKITGTLRSDNEYRTDIRRRVERDPRALVDSANQLLDAVHHALKDRKQRICVVFDNLEKIRERKQVATAILRRADDLRRLRCHAIYFMSPADQYTPTEDTRQIDQLFAPLVEVPMIPVRTSRDDADDALDERALVAITMVLERRIAIAELFADPRACVAAIARWSGGRLRDVIDLARHACEFADFDTQAAKVTVEHVDQAARKLAGRRLTVMQPKCWARAVEIHTDKQVDNRAEDALMLNHSLVLAYDGEPWWDVHPFLRTDRRFARAKTS